ncbi:uncharacterized protein [Apostichopus japonicus]|uniref:uncharacterized protein isoform X6 n=1 Tax=Stichopus japonicus TaxID=307972 RepID=UPI003AB4DEB3
MLPWEIYCSNYSIGTSAHHQWRMSLFSPQKVAIEILGDTAQSEYKHGSSLNTESSGSDSYRDILTSHKTTYGVHHGTAPRETSRRLKFWKRLGKMTKHQTETINWNPKPL